MNVFKQNTKLRLFFCGVYIGLAVWVLIESFAWLNIICFFLFVFLAYIAIVKSKMIKNRRVELMDDYKFDLFSILASIILVINVVRYFI